MGLKDSSGSIAADPSIIETVSPTLVGLGFLYIVHVTDPDGRMGTYHDYFANETAFGPHRSLRLTMLFIIYRYRAILCGCSWTGTESTLKSAHSSQPKVVPKGRVCLCVYKIPSPPGALPCVVRAVGG